MTAPPPDMRGVEVEYVFLSEDEQLAILARRAGLEPEPTPACTCRKGAWDPNCPKHGGKR